MKRCQGSNPNPNPDPNPNPNDYPNSNPNPNPNPNLDLNPKPNSKPNPNPNPKIGGLLWMERCLETNATPKIKKYPRDQHVPPPPYPYH